MVTSALVHLDIRIRDQAANGSIDRGNDRVHRATETAVQQTVFVSSITDSYESIPVHFVDVATADWFNISGDD